RLARPKLVLALIGLPVTCLTTTIHFSEPAIRPLLETSTTSRTASSVEATAGAVRAARTIKGSPGSMTAAAKAILVEPQSQLSASGTRAFLDTYCLGCHNQTRSLGFLRIDDMDVMQIGANIELWEKVVRKLRSGMEPNLPPGSPRPAL